MTQLQQLAYTALEVVDTAGHNLTHLQTAWLHGVGMRRHSGCLIDVKAEAKITKELAGTDTKSQEAEFLEYASQSESTSEFDALIGLTSETPAPKETKKEKEDKDSSALPE